MFNLHAVPGMFVGLLVLFAWCTLWGIVELVRSRTTMQRVSNALHLLMSLVMLLMVAPETWMPLRSLGFPVLIAVFALAMAWFVALALRPVGAGEPPARAHYVGHALMFGAMVWHVSGMAVMSALMGAGAGGHAMATPPPMVAVAWVGVPLMAALLVMGVRHLVALVAPARSSLYVHAEPSLAMAGCREPRPAGSPLARAHDAMAAAMNLGMFWMSAGLMVPLLPAFRLLQF